MPGRRSATCSTPDPTASSSAGAMTALTFDLSRTLAKGWRPGDEVVVTRLDHDANVRPWVHRRRDGRRRPSAGSTSTPRPASCAGDRRGGAQRPRRGWSPSPAPPTSSARRPTCARSPPSRTPPARCSTSTACTSPPTRRSTSRALGRRLLRLLAVQVPRTRTAGSWPPGPRCSSRCGPTSCCPSTDGCPSGSSWARCPTSCWQARRRRSTSWPAWTRLPPAASRRERLVASMAALEAHEDALRERSRRARAGLPGVTLWSRAARRTPTLLLTFERRDVQDVRAPGRARRQRARGFVLRLRGLAPARPGRGGRPADRHGALHRRRGRRPAPRCPRGGSGGLTQPQTALAPASPVSTTSTRVTVAATGSRTTSGLARVVTP